MVPIHSIQTTVTVADTDTPYGQNNLGYEPVSMQIQTVMRPQREST